MADQNFVRRVLDAERTMKARMAKPAEAQRELLEACVRPNAESAFGREHRFAAISGPDDYRRQVPIRDYDSFAPWIERAASGETGVLTQEPVIDFYRTSGTTGNNKKIPVTPSFRRAEVQRILAAWAAPYHRHPRLFDRDDAELGLSLVGLSQPDLKTKSGVAHVSAAVRFGEGDFDGQPGTHAPWAKTPDTVRDYRALNYYRARVAAEHDLVGVTALNPSTLVAFGEQLGEQGPDLVRELHDGTVLGRPHREPNPGRARELEAIIAREGRLEPRTVWPNLEVVQCWKHALCALYLHRVGELWGPSAHLMPLNFCASEGIIASVIDPDDQIPLAVHGTFLELAPPDVDAASEQPPTLLAHELRLGGEYQVIMTTLSGLYRYAIGDVLKVTGFYGPLACVEFIGRRGVLSSFTGEKLTEPQIHRAIAEAVDGWGRAVPTVRCQPVWGNPPHYAFWIESDLVDPAELARLAGLLERALAAANDEYPGKRKSGRLGPVEVVALPPGTFLRDRQARIDAGAPEVQLKDRLLLKEPDGVVAAVGSSAPRARA